MICARCDKPILEGEQYVKVDHHGASGPGTTEYVHAERCVPVPLQTKQLDPFGR